MRPRPSDRLALHVDVVCRPREAAARGLARWLARTAPARARGHVTVALVSDTAMRTLNRQYRGVDRATDVLSFSAFVPAHGAPRSGASARRSASLAGPPAPMSPRRSLGDIAIARGVAARQARAYGHSGATEVRVLALHGLLHLLGYDHEMDGGTMARVEARLRRRGGLPAGLIGRTRTAGAVRPERRHR